MSATFLVTMAIVTLLNRPIPHALMNCDHIVRMTDEQEQGEEAEEDGPGAVLETDSRGHMVLTVPEGEYVCAAWAKGYARKVFTLIVKHSQIVTVPLSADTASKP